MRTKHNSNPHFAVHNTGTLTLSGPSVTKFTKPRLRIIHDSTNQISVYFQLYYCLRYLQFSGCAFYGMYLFFQNTLNKNSAHMEIFDCNDQLGRIF